MTAPATVDRDRLRRTTAPHLLCERARTIPIRLRSAPSISVSIASDGGATTLHWWRVPAYALQSLGIVRGERVAIMGDVCEEWMICDLAAQSLGAIVYGIYPTASAAEVDHQMRDGGACIFIAEDQEYLEPVLPIADLLPDLRAIVVIDNSAMFGYRHTKLRRFGELLATAEKADLAWLEAQIATLSSSDPAFIVYTSGTTGHPKGALVTHGKHLAAADTVLGQYPTLREKEHRTVVYLPMCHVLGRDVAITLPLMSRLVPHFGEDAEDFATTLFEVGPTAMFTVPRYLQKFASHVLVGVLNASRLKHAAYNSAMGFSPKLCPASMGQSHQWLRTSSTALCAPASSGQSSTSLASTSWSSWLAAAPDCRQRPRRSGTCMGSMSLRCTVRPRKPAVSLPASVAPSRARGMLAHRSRAWTSAWRMTAKCWCTVPTCSRAIGTTMTRRVRLRVPTGGCAPAMLANGATARCG